MATEDIEDELRKWEEAIEKQRTGLKGDVSIGTTLKPEDEYIKATFSEPKKKETKRTKEKEVDLSKNKRKNKNPGSLF